MNFTRYPTSFSGHETFPLRQSWLKKIHKSLEDNIVSKDFFRNDDLIATYGVGKNMLASMRYWAIATGMLEDLDDHYKLNIFYESILGSKTTVNNKDIVGLDPFFENPNTTWFIHWRLVAFPLKTTTWFWLFNRLTATSFSKEDLVESISINLEGSGLKTSDTTLIRDVETCLRSYAPKVDTKGGVEDASDSLLIELGLLQESKRGVYTFKRGPKPSLSPTFFAFTIAEYWYTYHKDSNQLSFELIAYHDFSPGKAFKLDDESIMEYIDQIDYLTNGLFSWSSSAGIRQLVRNNKKWSELNLLKIFNKTYL